MSQTVSNTDNPLMNNYRVALLAIVTACTAPAAEVPPSPSDLADAGVPTFADLVLSFTESGSPVSCTESIAAICQQQAGVCAGHAALGSPDGVSFELEANGLLEIGFLCDPVVDKASLSEITPDFQVWATLSAGGSAVVSVSEDGSTYQQLDNFVSDNQTFDLSSQEIDFVRFVRIATNANTTMSVDAFEALR